MICYFVFVSPVSIMKESLIFFKSLLTICYLILISPILIPYTAFVCVEKTVGLSPKRHKLTLEIFGVDYVLDFESQNETK